MEKAREFQKNIYICLLTIPKPLTVWITTNWKILKEMGMLDHLICLQRSLYAGQEATVKTRHGTMDWFKIGKVVHQGCILLPCLFNFYAQDIIQMLSWMTHKLKSSLLGRNIKNNRYADDTTLMAKREEELKSLLMKVKKSGVKASSKLNIHGIWPHYFMANKWRKNGNSHRLYFLGLQNHCRQWL